jgi:hypothetical protein
MILHAPLQIAVGPNAGRYHFCRNSERSGPLAIGYCAQYRSCKTCDALHAFPALPDCAECKGKGLIPLDIPCAGHETPDEAREHYRQYELNERLRLIPGRPDAGTLKRCQAKGGCSHYTAGQAVIGAYRCWYLCDEHRTKEMVASLYIMHDFYES